MCVTRGWVEGAGGWCWSSSGKGSPEDFFESDRGRAGCQGPFEVGGMTAGFPILEARAGTGDVGFLLMLLLWISARLPRRCFNKSPPPEKVIGMTDGYMLRTRVVRV